MVPKEKVPVVFKVPPLKIMLSSSTVPGVAPILAEDEIAIVPAEMVVEPEYVLDPDNVKVPDPALVRAPAPEMTPEMVSSPPSPVSKLYH